MIAVYDKLMHALINAVYVLLIKCICILYVNGDSKQNHHIIGWTLKLRFFLSRSFIKLYEKKIHICGSSRTECDDNNLDAKITMSYTRTYHEYIPSIGLSLRSTCFFFALLLLSNRLTLSIGVNATPLPQMLPNQSR